MKRAEKIRIGDLLVSEKLLTAEQLATALETQKRSGKRLGRVFVEQGYVTEEQIAEVLARQLAVPFVNLKFYNLNAELVRRLPEAHARRHRAILLEDRKSTLLLGMADPTDLFAQDELARILKREIDFAVVVESLLVQTIDRVYRRTEEIAGLTRELERDIGDSAVDFGALGAAAGAEDAPVVRLLQKIFEDASQVGASDIHIEPQEGLVQVRFRIDGELLPQSEADKRIGPALVQRVKLSSGLDISEKRMPQDGRFNVMVRGQPVDVRLSTMPTQYGESVVMRLLSQRSGLLGLEHLGMPADMLPRFRDFIHRTNTMLLVTGPTGSGKTTTLYASLAELNTPDRKIITVEDPVEYRLPGINQVQVNEKIDLSFARVLRSALRQDPDIILIGEIRDEETAQIGLRAALTGHFVLSTLHTRDAASTPARLIDMGAPAYMVASSLQAVLAQRLVRVICESCREERAPSPQEAQWAQLALGERAGGTFFSGRGCSRCNGTGYLGRTAVYEMLEMSADLVRAVQGNDPTVFSSRAKEQMRGRTLAHNAAALALAGRTTLAEAIKVSSIDEE